MRPAQQDFRGSIASIIVDGYIRKAFFARRQNGTTLYPTKHKMPSFVEGYRVWGYVTVGNANVVEKTQPDELKILSVNDICNN
jgi:hypothetical protein